MFSAEYYEDLRGRATALLIEAEYALLPDQRAAIAELIDHNEPGVADEMLTAILDEAGGFIEGRSGGSSRASG